MVWVVGIIALIVGFLIGWWFARQACETKITGIEAAWKVKLDAAEAARDRAVADAEGARNEADEARGAAKAAQSDAEAARAEAAEAKSAAEQAATDAAEAGKAREAALAEAGEARSAADAARGEADEARAAADAARGEADEARSAAEATRSEAEAAAAQATSDIEAANAKAAESAEAAARLAAFAAPAPDADPDNLTKVEGIGPKIAGLLNDDGITTFAGLAAAEVSRLQGILDAAGSRYRVHDPSTWPTQAALAAAGHWGALEGLQDHLKGGREG